MSFIDKEDTLESNQNEVSCEKEGSDEENLDTMNSDKNGLESSVSKQNGHSNSKPSRAIADTDSQSNENLAVLERTPEPAKKRRKIIPDDD